MDAKMLPCEERGTGRGHGARVIAPSAMVEYLTERARALSLPRGKRPKGFQDVVKAPGDAR